MDSEASLYQRSTEGDAAALEELLQRYLPQLHAFVQFRLSAAMRARESSMDVVQSVCRELLAARERFEFRGEDRFRAWLFTSALNKILHKQRFHRQERRDPAREDRAEPATDLTGAVHLLTPSLDAIGKETALAVESALAALSADHREVITLSRIVQLPHSVVAELMERNEVAVRQLLARAMVRFTMELRARGIEFPA